MRFPILRPQNDLPPRRRGFTLVEVLVTISVIAILVGIAVVAYHMLQPKGNQTKMVLGNLQSMLAEYQKTKGQAGLPVGSIRITGASLLVTGGPARDYFTDPNYDNASANPTPAASTADIKRPGFVTRDVMKRLLSIVENSKAITSLPQQAFLKSNDDEVGLNPRKLADSWENPILYVPGPDESLASTDVNYYGLAGVTVGGTTDLTIRAPDRRGFFVSAGPDGDFKTGDDNIYSFNQ